MPATIQISTATKERRSLAIVADLDKGSSFAQINFYGGTVPTIGSVISSTLIVAIPLNKPSGTVDALGLHLTASAAGQVVADGTITWGMAVDSDGNKIFLGSALLNTDPAAATAAFVLDKITVYTGGFVSLASALLVEGG
jgi:hypothetical protein